MRSELVKALMNGGQADLETKYIYTNILKGAREEETVPRGALPMEF